MNPINTMNNDASVLNSSDVIKARIDYLTGAVDADNSAQMLTQLMETNVINSDEQKALRKELDFVDLVYKQELPMETPSSDLDDRFYAMLNQVSANQVSAVEEKSPDKSPTFLTAIKSWFEKLAPAPVWQAAALVTVFAVGYQTNDEQSNLNPSTVPNTMQPQLASNSQIEALNQQVSNLNALVAMSMINSESASKRLAGIEYSAKVSSVDDELNQALLQLLQSDSSTSIRLSALNAITNQGRKFGLSQTSLQALTDSLQGQSTLIQVNIISTLLELGDDNTLKALKQLATDNALNEDAKSFLTEVQNQAPNEAI